MLGLTYKLGTDTLRRSSSIELCRWLIEHGADVRVHDPKAQRAAAEEALGPVQVCESAADALQGAEAVVIATPWPDYAQLPAAELPAVFDPHSLLAKAIPGTQVEYHAVGRPDVRR